MKIRILLPVAMILAASTAYSADSMRCGNRVVSDGDPKVKVAELCGKPTATETRTIYRSGIPRLQLSVEDGAAQSASSDELLIHDRSHVEVEVDVWVYNRGRSRLLREVVFENNRVVEVNVLGRGY
ncbi:MAG TPA: DUF2845 domain-containing protein [Gammaproteobacteria bacterium]|jgi:hypothetical protein